MAEDEVLVFEQDEDDDEGLYDLIVSRLECVYMYMLPLTRAHIEMALGKHLAREGSILTLSKLSISIAFFF